MPPPPKHRSPGHQTREHSLHTLNVEYKADWFRAQQIVLGSRWGSLMRETGDSFLHGSGVTPPVVGERVQRRYVRPGSCALLTAVRRASSFSIWGEERRPVDIWCLHPKTSKGFIPRVLLLQPQHSEPDQPVARYQPCESTNSRPGAAAPPLLYLGSQKRK